MDLRSYYKKLRDVERTIAEEFPVIVSKETPEGGKPGVLTEVPRALAARLVAESRAEVADAKTAARYREEAEEKRHAAEQLLAGGPGTLPLAAIGDVTASDLPAVIERLKEKLAAPRYRKTVGTLWTAVDVLMGLRYDRAVIEQLLQGVRGMKESVTYQAIVEEGVAKGIAKGELRGARRIIFHQGEQRFAQPPDASARSRIESIESLDVLEHLSDRIFQVHSWEELLADAVAPVPRRGRRKE